MKWHTKASLKGFRFSSKNCIIFMSNIFNMVSLSHFPIVLLSIFAIYCSCNPHAHQKFATEKPLPDSIRLTLQRIETAVCSKDTAFLDSCSMMLLDWKTDTLYFYEQDTSLWIARKKEGQWTLLDRVIGHGISHINTIDVNADGYTDILVIGYPQMNGHSPTLPILAGKDGSLQVRTDCILWNFVYVPERNVVRSSWEGSWYATKFKEEYHWVNDSLQLSEGVRLIIDGTRWNDTSNITTLEYYHLQGNSEVITKRIVSDSNDEEYSTALWPGYGDPE